MSRTTNKASVHPVYYPDFIDLETPLTGLGARVMHSKDLLEIAVQARQDSIGINGIDEDPGVVNFLNQVIEVIFQLTGQEDSALAGLKKRLADEQAAFMQRRVSHDNSHTRLPAYEVGSIGPDRCIEILCNLHKLSVGLEEYEQNVLVDFGIYLAEFYAAWHDDAQ